MKLRITMVWVILICVQHATGQGIGSVCYTDSENIENIYSGSIPYNKIDEVGVRFGTPGGFEFIHGPTATLSFGSYYNSYLFYVDADGKIPVYLEYKRCVLNNCSNFGEHETHTQTLYMYGNGHMSISQTEFCSGDLVNLNAITEPGTGSFTTTGDMDIDAVNNLDPEPGTPGSHDINHVVNTTLPGCVATKNYTVIRHPDSEVEWTATPGPYVDNGPQVDLAPMANSPTGDPVAFVGAGVTGFQYFDPTLSGDGNWLVVAATNSAEGCHAYDTVNIVVNHDPGVITGPLLIKPDESVLVAPVSVFLQASMLCDGKTYPFEVYNPNPSYTYKWYFSNTLGTLDTLGVGNTMNVPISDNPTLEHEFLYVSTINNLGIEGPKRTFLIYSHPVVQKPNMPDTLCYDGFVDMLLDHDYSRWTNVLYDSMFTSGVVDTALWEKSRTYLWRDEFGTVIDTSYQFAHTFTGSKVVKVTRQVIDSIPYSYSVKPDVYSGYIGCECRSTIDTVWVVQKPNPSFVFAGSSVVDPGDPVQFFNESQYEDSIVWNFNDGTPLFFDDTLWHYFNDQGSQDIQLTAWDNYGCNADTISFGAINVTSWLSLSEDLTIQNILAAPNPFTDHVSLIIEAKYSGSMTVEVYNMAGQLVKVNDYYTNLGLNEFKVSMEDRPSGLYLMNVKTEVGQITLKITKQ